MNATVQAPPKGRGRPPTGQDPVVSVRFPRELLDRLTREAAAAGRSRSDLIRELILLGFDRQASELIEG